MSSLGPSQDTCPLHLSLASASHSCHCLLPTFQSRLNQAGVCSSCPWTFIDPSYYPSNVEEAIKMFSFILQRKGTKNKNLTTLYLQHYFKEKEDVNHWQGGCLVV